jgi:hypothetical protein
VETYWRWYIGVAAEGKGRPCKGVPEGNADRAQGLGHRLRILAGRKQYLCCIPRYQPQRLATGMPYSRPPLKKRSISTRLSNLFQVPVPSTQQSFHVACENQPLSQPPKDAEGSRERKQINHERPR